MEERAFSKGERAKVRCYGANDVIEGVAIMIKEEVDAGITGNSTNPTRFQHPVSGTYKNGASKTEENTSQLLPAAARVVPSTPTTLRRVLLLTA